MNWSRGFFRFWIVLSVAYALAAVWIIGLDTLRPLIKPHARYEVELKGGTVRTFDTTKPREELIWEMSSAFRDDAIALAMKGRRNEAVADALESSDKLLTELYGQDQTRTVRAYQSLGIVLGPPVALLALGAIIGWIARPRTH
jgi:hypothetical protein